MLRSKLTYLNFILTVIAIGLTAIVLQNANVIPAAKANSYSGLPLNEKGELMVRMTNEVVDVNIAKVGGYNTYGTVPVKVND